jgi:hypothetical protein
MVVEPCNVDNTSSSTLTAGPTSTDSVGSHWVRNRRPNRCRYDAQRIENSCGSCSVFGREGNTTVTNNNVCKVVCRQLPARPALD